MPPATPLSDTSVQEEENKTEKSNYVEMRKKMLTGIQTQSYFKISVLNIKSFNVYQWFGQSSGGEINSVV